MFSPNQMPTQIEQVTDSGMALRKRCACLTDVNSDPTLSQSVFDFSMT